MTLPMTPRALLAATALLACVALAGCGSSGSASSQPSSPSTPPPASASSQPAPAPVTAPSPAPAPSNAVDSMTVVTRAQAAAALGESVRAAVRGKATVEGGVAAVFYGPSVPGGANPDVPVVNSVRVVLVKGADALKWFDDYRGKVHAVALSGLGDKAYYDGYASVSALKGDGYLRISVIGPRGISESAEKKLVAEGLARM